MEEEIVAYFLTEKRGALILLGIGCAYCGDRTDRDKERLPRDGDFRSLTWRSASGVSFLQENAPAPSPNLKSTLILPAAVK